jgi:membrane protein implicated in regulation of membrane protease activity
LAASIGAFLGMTIAMAVVSGFAAMILVPVFNVYYAAIFFFVGSVYSYKIIKKNQI